MEERIYIAGGERHEVCLGLAHTPYTVEPYHILVYDRADLSAPLALIEDIRPDGSADCVVWDAVDETYIDVCRPLREEERDVLAPLEEEMAFALEYEDALFDMARFKNHPQDYPEDYYTFITDRRCFFSWEVFDYFSPDIVDMITFSVCIPIGRHGVYREVVYDIAPTEENPVGWQLSGKPVECLIALSRAEFTKRVVKTVRSLAKAERLLGNLEPFYALGRQKIAHYEPELVERCILSR